MEAVLPLSMPENPPQVQPAPPPAVYHVVCDARGASVQSETTGDFDYARKRALRLSTVYWCDCWLLLDEPRTRVGTARYGFWHEERES